MPNSVLNQLKALRDGVAQDLRKDPRYLTLQALDKSIEEVTAVLSASGLLPAAAATPSLTQRLNGLAPHADRYAEPAAVLAASEPPAPAPHEADARSSLGFKDGTAGSPPPAVPHGLFAPSSMPALEVAGAAAVAAAMAEAVDAAARDHQILHEEPAARNDGLAPQAQHEEVPHEHAEPETAAVAEPEHQSAGAHSDGPGEAGALAPEALAENAPGLEPSRAPDAEAGHEAAQEPVEAGHHDDGLAADHAGSGLPVIAGADAPAAAMDALAAALFLDEANHDAAQHDDTQQNAAHAEPAVAEADHAEPEHLDETGPTPVAEAASLDDHLTADLEAALEEMAAKSSPAEPGVGEPAGDAVHHDAALDEVPAAAAHAPEGHEQAGGEPVTGEHAGEIHANGSHDAGSALEEAVDDGAVLEDSVFKLAAPHETAREAATPVAEQEPDAGHELEAAASNPAFDVIAADAIAAALFAEEAPAAEASSEAPDTIEEDAHAAAAPAHDGTGSRPDAEHHAAPREASVEEPGPSGENAVAAIGEDAVAAALFASDTFADEGAPASAAPEDQTPTADESALDGIENAIAAALFSDEPETETTPEASSPPEVDIIPADKASGYIAMAPKPGAAQYSPSIAVKFGKLPARVDLRPLLAPVEDQEGFQSSVAHAVAAAYEYWIQKATKKPQHLSRSFIYYNARWRAGQPDGDAGSAIQLALEGLQRFGACPETAWPSHPELVTQRPGAEAYRDAASYRVHDMAQVPLKVESWKQALAEGKPIVFGLVLFDTFAASTSSGGVVAMPAPEHAPHAAHAIHALCACGYNDAEKVFIVRNSWGEDFGDKGYCYIPYDYLMNPKFNDGDAWIFVPKVPSQPPRETWSETQDPVVNGGQGVDFVIPSYPASEYAALTKDFFEGLRQPWHAAAPDDYNACAGKVAKNQFDDLAPFDVKSFLVSHGGAGSPPETAESGSTETESDEWGNALSWGVSTAIDHGRPAPSPHHETETKVDAELTQ